MNGKIGNFQRGLPQQITARLVAGLVLLTSAGCGQEATTTLHDESTAEEQANPQAHSESAADDQTLNLRGQSGLRIDGRTISADPSVVIEDCDGVMLINCDLRSVSVRGSTNILVVNSHLHDSPNNAVYFDDCETVLVQGNRVERVRTGVLAHRSTGVRMIGNYVEDVQGPMPGGQLVQFDKVTGPGNVVAQNYGVNHRDTSNPEDMISMYQSHGTEESPILIEDNYLMGDPVHGSAGKSGSGSGIMLGDGGGSWQTCVANKLINPGQAGIGVASGEDIVVQFNVVRGERSDVSNVGVYVWEQYDQPAGRVVVFENIVAWVDAQDRDNPFWDGGGFRVVERGNNTFGGRAMLDDIPAPSPPSVAPSPPRPYVDSDE